MKRIRILAFSQTGWQAGTKIVQKLTEEGYEVILNVKSKYLSNSYAGSIQDYANLGFEDSDALLFIGSCGIAVRAVAPFLKGKKQDPAVLVMDECQKHVISLLSGHLGGANDLTKVVAACTGAEAVITTATDLHEQFAVDVFAKKQDCSILNMQAAKEVSAALLHGEAVGFYSDFAYDGELPQGLVLCTKEGNSIAEGKKLEVGIAVTIKKDRVPFSSTAIVIPRCVSVGIGCRKDKNGIEMMQKLEELLQREELYLEAVKKIASVDLKAEETGIHFLCEKYQLPFVTYTAKELREVKGEFTPSAFVASVIGVDNVCERSSVLASGNGKLIMKKAAGNGSTFAFAIEDWRIQF